jgi:hypothetical protein
MKQGLCEVCKVKPATEQHHLFSQGTKKGWRYKLYKDLLHDTRNIIWVCENCHKWKGVPKISETEFCKRLNIELRSKKVNKF